MIFPKFRTFHRALRETSFQIFVVENIVASLYGLVLTVGSHLNVITGCRRIYFASGIMQDWRILIMFLKTTAESEAYQLMLLLTLLIFVGKNL
jgi:glucose-6-phosphate-specific signal transduction histidine kinase